MHHPPLYRKAHGVRWDWLEETDIESVGPPEYRRNTAGLRTKPQQQIAMIVTGQYVERLGLVCLRCERKGESLLPLTLSIADTVSADE